MNTISSRNTCRLCGSKELTPIVDLDHQCLGSLFPTQNIQNDECERYPLKLVRCSGVNQCGLVQLQHSIARDILFVDYGYLSGINELMRANLKEIAQLSETLISLEPGDCVLDIGCNDGTLLCSYESKYIQKIGFEPATNVAQIAKTKGLDVIEEFFEGMFFREHYPTLRPRIISSIAVLYDLEDPITFVKNIADILADDGIWVVELSYMPLMLERNAFDTICHEHLGYYTLKQIDWILDTVDFEIYKLELNGVNGGSFRMFIQHKDARPIPQDNLDYLEEVRQRETNLGFDTGTPFEDFEERIQQLRDELLTKLNQLQREGKRIYGYGASTKGNTLLQFCNIDDNIITKIADRNPTKWGKFTPGSYIPIVSEEEVRSEQPDYMLVLPWHFMSSFIEREREFLRIGGKFIVPLPEVRIIGKEILASLTES